MAAARAAARGCGRAGGWEGEGRAIWPTRVRSTNHLLGHKFSLQAARACGDEPMG